VKFRDLAIIDDHRAHDQACWVGAGPPLRHLLKQKALLREPPVPKFPAPAFPPAQLMTIR
jgi:hypothetical protein